MKKLIIEIDEPCYEDAINDTEWDTLSLGIYFKEKIKEGKPLQAELEEIKAELQTPNLPGDKVIIRDNCYISLSYILYIMDKHIKEDVDENNN